MHRYWDTGLWYWSLVGNCYWLVSAWVCDDRRKISFLDDNAPAIRADLLDTLWCTDFYETMPHKIYEKMQRLAKKNKDKAASYIFNQANKIVDFIDIIDNLIKEHNKMLIIEFFDGNKKSMHVAFITPQKKVYDKINIFKINFWHDIKEIFGYRTVNWSEYYKIYVLDEEKSRNADRYISYLELMKQEFEHRLNNHF